MKLFTICYKSTKIVSGDIRRFDNTRSTHFWGKIEAVNRCFLLHFILFCVGVNICFIPGLIMTKLGDAPFQNVFAFTFQVK